MGLLQSKEEKAAAEAKRIADAAAKEVERVEDERVRNLIWPTAKAKEDAKALFRGWVTDLQGTTPREVQLCPQVEVFRMFTSMKMFHADNFSYPYEVRHIRSEGKKDIEFGFAIVDEKARIARRYIRADSSMQSPKIYSPKTFTYQPELAKFGTTEAYHYIHSLFTSAEREAIPYVTIPDLIVPRKTEHQLLMEKLEEVSLGLKHIVAANDKKELAAEVEGILAALPAVPPKCN